MTTEENKRLLALSGIIADMKKNPIEFEQREHQLLDDYNEVVRQANSEEKRKDEVHPVVATQSSLEGTSFQRFFDGFMCRLPLDT